ncbi:MAG: urea transporter [Polyangiaceae bacterium]|nr:urea transporter [Polyangiaceae bacterium]
MAPALSERDTLRATLEALLRPYGQIVFSRDLRSGALVLLGLGAFPRLFAVTLLAVVTAQATSLVFGLGVASVRNGGAATTAVLATMALAAFAPGGGHPLVGVVIASVLAVLLSASFEAVFAPVALPTHSLPFVAAAWIAALAARVLPAAPVEIDWLAPASFLPPSWFAPSWLDVPAAIVFTHGGVTGVLLLAAIGLHSRISLLLALIGGAVAVGMRLALRADVPWSGVDTIASFNAVLTAMALGGVWFVPQPSSLLLAALGSAVSVVIAHAAGPVLGLAFLPVLSLPFVITTHLVLTAARRREADRRPRSTLPAERPEEALARHLARVRRFGDMAWLPFRLPFRGQWWVSQGYDGPHTHQGLWRHGLDFEVQDKDGKVFRREGRALGDYHAYGLPVLAAGLGTVASVVDGVPDNPPGEVNTLDNWGNAVVIAHGAGLHSVYAHLQQSSVRVRAGEVVAAGAEIARCGNSGRSPVPHLHFQVQRLPLLGSPTLGADFGDVVTQDGERSRVSGRVVPAEGTLVRPVLRDDALARALAFTPGSSWEISADDGRRELGRVELDLLGRRILKTHLGQLVLDPYESGLVIVDFAGSSRSLLGWVLLALARVPFDQAAGLVWEERLPKRLLLTGIPRAVADFFAVFAPDAGNLEVRFASQRDGGAVVVESEHEHGAARARVSLGDEPHRIAITHDGRQLQLELRPTNGRDEKERGR